MSGDTITGSERVNDGRSFDRFILLIIGALIILLALLIWRGDRAGVAIVTRSPADGANRVSGLATIRVHFGQAMDINQLPDIRLTPEISGTVRWEDETTLAFQPHTPLLPDTTYMVRIPAGISGVSGRPLRREQSWQFTTRSLRVLYMAWDEDRGAQLYIVPSGGGASRQLTQAPLGVLDYTLSPDGTMIVFSGLREGGSSDLWQLPVPQEGDAQTVEEATLLLNCDDDQCAGPSWAPDGRRLVYERRNVFESGAPPGPPRLWWLAPQQGETTPLFSDSQLLGHSARFSRDGRWLAYVVPLEQAMQFFDFETGDVVRIGNEIGEPASWHPWRNELLMTNIEYQGESFSVYLFHLALPDAETTNLSGDINTNDAAPAWSPDGDWIAFGRRVPRTPMGRQLWLMRPDGSELTLVTEDLDSNFGPPSWSPDSGQLLVQRFNIQEPNSDPGIWLVDVDDGELHEVVEVGFQPQWLP